ncbi:MAG: UDP-N-acetylmuramoyl-L-alanyl-D-glutamate--2,6-diaminopimelate ligase [Acidobacteriota bacterium]
MMKITDIARELGARIGGGTVENGLAGAVTHDSRQVVPGGVFVAIKGQQVDGHQYVGQALDRGAVAIISEEPCPPDFPGVWLQVDEARVALARVAASLNGNPSAELALVGVTGTNGKTTTTWLVESIFRAAGLKTAAMGTISYRIGDDSRPADFTTPEASEIQNFLREAVDQGVTHAVMEVSSIALEMHRADRLKFAVAAFTNLTQDHLDFHQTMEAYFAAKRKLFDGTIGRHPDHAVINVDDPYGKVMARDWTAEGGELWTYALDARADISIQTVRGGEARAGLHFGLDGLHFTAETPRGPVVVDSPMVGRPHAYNILCALGIGLSLGLSPEIIAAGIRQCQGVPGRFERVSSVEDGITVIVDYAHTPDALANVLRTINSARRGGTLTTIFGCGGDRDRTKRPLMGEEAGRLSDEVIITSDNPRREDPLLIMNDIRVGIDRTGRKNYQMIVDRREAIFEAIARARPGDVILLAGKGHENYQILATGKIDFDDREVAREALRDRRSWPGRPTSGAGRVDRGM